MGIAQHSFCSLRSLRPTRVRLALHTWTRAGADPTTPHFPSLWCILAPSHERVKHRGSSIPQQKRRRIVMEPIITTDIVVAYSQCPRKAYKLLYTDTQGTPHEYIAILEEEASKNRESHLKKIMGKHSDGV